MGFSHSPPSARIRALAALLALLIWGCGHASSSGRAFSYGALGNLPPGAGPALIEAQGLLSRGELVEAEKAFERLRLLAPQHPAAYLGLAEVQSGLGKNKEALENCRLAEVLAGESPEPHVIAGWVLFREGDLHAALVEFREGLEKDPLSDRAQNGLGVVLYEGGNPSGAEDHFREAVALNPSFAQAHFNLGCLLWEKRRLLEAIEQFRVAIDLDPGLAEARLNLGSALAESGDVEAARDVWKELAQEMPRDPVLRQNLALASIVLKDLKGAEEEVAALKEMGYTPGPEIRLGLERLRGEEKKKGFFARLLGWLWPF